MNISESVRTAMRETNALFCSSVVNMGEIDALDNIYTEDARILPPGANMIQGRARIKAFWEQAIAGLGLKDAKLVTLDAQAAGESVIEVGQADLTLGL